MKDDKKFDSHMNQFGKIANLNPGLARGQQKPGPSLQPASSRSEPPINSDHGYAGRFSLLEQNLTLQKVLLLVGVGRTTWLELVSRGEAPPPVKVGRRNYWLLSEIQKWISELAAKRPRLM